MIQFLFLNPTRHWGGASSSKLRADLDLEMHQSSILRQQTELKLAVFNVDIFQEASKTQGTETAMERPLFAKPFKFYVDFTKRIGYEIHTVNCPKLESLWELGQWATEAAQPNHKCFVSAMRAQPV